MRQWLTGHAQDVAGAGRNALEWLLRLAARDGIVLAGQIRTVVEQLTGENVAPGWTLHLAAWWARSVPVPARDRDWILVVERLLIDTVEQEHAADRAHWAELLAVGAEGETPGTGAPAGEEDRARISRETGGRLPVHEVTALLRELVVTVRPGEGGDPYPQMRMLRAVTTGLLRRDLGLTAPAARPLAYRTDLHTFRVGEPVAFTGPMLARNVLDLAAADAAAGIGLGERTKACQRIAGADARLHGRLLASHLSGCAPRDAGGVLCGPGEDAWWDEACALVPRLLADSPDPGTARFTELVLRVSTNAPVHRAADRRPPSARRRWSRIRHSAGRPG
ncbi:hypothetical protein A6A29_40490 [Streptomyces sp. TSRI0281]|nr:hypothetical protein A6A29_40490 [Streptomyces sp. TSRI0281]